MHVVHNDLVSQIVCHGLITRPRRNVLPLQPDSVVQEAERHGRLVSEVKVQLGQGRRVGLDPRRGASFETPQLEPEAVEGVGEADGGRVAHPPGRDHLEADVDLASQESPCGKDDAAVGLDSIAVGKNNSNTPVVTYDEILNRGLDDFEVRR